MSNCGEGYSKYLYPVDFAKIDAVKGGRKVPFITIELLEGRTHEQKKELMEKITSVVTETLNVPADRVFIFIEDLKADHYARGGVFASEANQVKK